MCTLLVIDMRIPHDDSLGAIQYQLRTGRPYITNFLVFTYVQWRQSLIVFDVVSCAMSSEQAYLQREVIECQRSRYSARRIENTNIVPFVFRTRSIARRLTAI